MAGEYLLLRKLGEGGFGAVYEAEHPVLKRKAAVKVLHQVAGVDSEGVLRFMSEAQAVNQIHSRYIVDIFSFGRLADGRHFYVMDLLDGEPLDRCLERLTRLEVPAALQLLVPIAEALDAAHAAGIVHRDLKPQNIFLSWEPDGQTVPKLLDFGMAKLLSMSPVHTASGTPMGTPLYMSPEQARGDKVDGRADVYAFGVLCHELLTGQVPISGESAIVVLMRHVMQAPPRASEVFNALSPELDAPILRMLEKDPEQRPATAGAALRELREAAERAGYTIPSGMPSLPRPPRNAPPTPSVTPRRASPYSTPLDGGPSFPDTPRDVMVRSQGSTARPRVVGWPFWLGVAVLGAGVIFLGGGGLRSNDWPSREPVVSASSKPLPVPVPVAAPSATPAIQPEPAPTSVEVTLKGVPSGARVLRGDEQVGSAPGPFSLGAGRDPVELKVVAPGYEPSTVTVVPDHPLTLDVTLKKRARAPRGKQTISSDLESPF